MKRTQIYLGEEQDAKLAKRAKRDGVTKSSLIRRAVDRYLEEDSAEDLEAFRRAVRKAAGSIPRLPPGKEYVENLRKVDLERQRELDERWGRE